MKGIILTALLVFFNVNVAQAACDTKSLKGTYTITGGTNGREDNYNCGIVGIATFDGKGALKIRSVQGCAQPVNSTVEFSYSLDTACMGRATQTIANEYESQADSYFVFNKLLSTGSIMMHVNGLFLFATMNKQ
jgi:hypothetical protein